MMNMEFFRAINNLANKNIFLDKVMIFFSQYVPYIFMVILAFLFIYGVIKKDGNTRAAVVNTFVLTVINLILAYFIGVVYYVDRPFVHNKVNLLFPHVKDSSFPSDHATGTMSIALGLNKYNKLWGKVLALVSIIVGFSRIYVGHHYPADVIGAYVMVFITNYLYNLRVRDKIGQIYDKIERKISAMLGITWLYE